MDSSFDLARHTLEQGQALLLHRRNGDDAGQVRALARLANLANNQADYPAALDYLDEADAIARRTGDAALAVFLDGHLLGILLELREPDSALAVASRCVEATAGQCDSEARMLALNGLGCALGLAGRHADAVRELERAHAIVPRLASLPEHRRWHYTSQSLADLSWALLDAGRPRDALERAREGAELATRHGIAPLRQLNQRYHARAALALGDPQAALASFDESLQLARQLGLTPQAARIQLERAEGLAALDRHREAYDALRDGHALEEGWQRERAAGRLAFRRARGEIDAARREAESAERVLLAVLPPAIARRVRAGESRIADEVPSVSVLFADLVGFTPWSRQLPVARLLAELDRIFTRFDAIASAERLEKIKTIGDAYMAAGGALAPEPDHVERCVRMAQGMLAAVEDHNRSSGTSLALRIGVHVGPAIAGVIGSQRLSYDLWGETVNIAARLEASGLPGRIHVSQAVVDALGAGWRCEPRGPTDLKGIGALPTFLVG